MNSDNKPQTMHFPSSSMRNRESIPNSCMKYEICEKDLYTLLPIARPKPHATAPTSRSPTCVLRVFLTLDDEYQPTTEQTKQFK